MAKRIFYGDDARRRILAGAEMLYDAVKVTMSPKGGNAVLGRIYGGPSVTHDGVTVAKSIELPDVDDETLGYRVGAELIKDAASKMNDTVGDGTTTITVLTYNLLKEANKLISAGHNPMIIKRELDKATDEVIAKLEKLSKPVDTEEKLADVTTISAGEREIGSLVANIMHKIGKDGVVTVEAGQSLSTEAELVEGYSFDRGFISPYMVTDVNRLEARYENPAVVITDKAATSIQEMLPLLSLIMESGRKSMLLIAPAIDGDLLPNLIVNKEKGIFSSVAVKAPSFGDNQKQTLHDIARLVGGKVITDDEAMTFANVDLTVVGGADKVIVGANSTTIIGGHGASEDVESRIAQIVEQEAKQKDDYEKEKLRKRRAALSGKVAVIRVGGATETEIEEKKYRVDDAVAAAKAAMAEGVVAGGGVTLVNIANELKDDTSGAKLLKTALEQPFRIITSNAGLNSDEWLPQVRNAKAGMGVNVMGDEKLVDLIADGVTDPAMVTKEAVKNAVSLAGTAMTMGTLVVEIPEKINPNDTGMPL